MSQIALDDVFDDPEHGEPGRDRMAVHVVWEVTLLLVVAVLGYLVWRNEPGLFQGASLRSLLVAVVVLGLLTVGAGLSLRAAAPNFAIGPVAVAAALHFAEQGDQGLLAALGPALAVAVAGGLLLALLVVVLHVPAWAVSLAGATGVIVYIERRTGPVLTQGDFDPSGSVYYLFAGFAAVAVLGGMLGTVRAVRRLVGRFRPVADPAQRRGAVAAVITVLAFVVSTVLALLAGVLVASPAGQPIVPSPGLDWTALAFGVALLGGTSAFGRRGGVFGGLLAVVLTTLFFAYVRQRGWQVDRYAAAGGAIVAGLVVTRLVESYGRPRSAVDGVREPEPLSGGSDVMGWNIPRPAPAESWPPTMPAEPAGTRTDPWGVRRWEHGSDPWARGTERRESDQDRWNP